jgi:AcrR family transcriptional regulator
MDGRSTSRLGAARAEHAAGAGARRGRPRSEAVRRKVLQAAVDILESRGFKATTIEAIAERAGASKVTLYRWWPGKAAIATDALLEVMSPAAPFPHTDAPLADLREQMISLVRMLTGRWGAIIAGLVAEGVFDDDVRATMIARWLEPRRAEGRRVIARGQALGEIRADLDAGLVLDALYGPIYLRVLFGHEPLTPDFAARVWDAAVAGLTPRSEAAVSERGTRGRAGSSRAPARKGDPTSSRGGRRAPPRT